MEVVSAKGGTQGARRKGNGWCRGSEHTGSDRRKTKILAEARENTKTGQNAEEMRKLTTKGMQKWTEG